MQFRCIARVVGEDFVTQAGAVDMDVDFGSRYALVAQHLLDGAQVGATFKQMGGEAVAQGVRTDVFSDAGQFAQLLDDVENHLAREHGAVTIQKEDVLTAAFCRLMVARLLQIEVDLFNGGGGDGYQALLVALALDDDIAFLQEEL